MDNTPNKEELDSISLGNIDNINGAINDIPPVPTIDPVTLPNQEPETLGMPNNIEMNPNVPPVTPNYDVPPTVNNYETPNFNNIGNIPPIGNDSIGSVPPQDNGEVKPKKKKSMNKTTFIIIIILSLVIVGSIVYMLLNLAKNKKTTVIPKEVSIEIGSEVSTKVTDYVILTNIDPSACSLDISNIKDTEKLNAEYSYTVTCSGISYTGKAKIVDTTVPIVETKDVTTGVNKEVEASDFIVKCEDKTECSYEFKDKTQITNAIKEIGEYKIDVIVKDESGNTTEVTGNLTVSATSASLYLACTKAANGYTEKTKFGMESGGFNKTAIRNYIFTIDNANSYNELKEASKDNDSITYKEITGSPEFSDTDRKVTISKIITYDELNKEMNTTLPLTYGDLKVFYESKGYTCTPER